MKKNLSLLAALFAALIVSSCAHTDVEKKVDQEIKNVPVAETKAISKTVKEQIAASGLTAEQKEKLSALEEKAHAEYVAINDEIERTKVVFIQTVIAPKMDQREYSILKKKLTALDKTRLANGFRNAEAVRKIISPKAQVRFEDQAVYKAVLENRLNGF